MSGGFFANVADLRNLAIASSVALAVVCVTLGVHVGRLQRRLALLENDCAKRAETQVGALCSDEACEEWHAKPSERRQLEAMAWIDELRQECE